MLLFFLIIAILNLRNSHGNHPEKFICENNSCSLATSPSNHSLLFYESMELCRLICGEYGNLWPIPTENLKLGRMAMEIDPTNVYISIESSSHQPYNYLKKVGDLFVTRLKQGCQVVRTPSTKVQLILRARSNDITLDMNTEESYKLSVHTNGQLIEAVIEGDNVYGVRHGLETLLQLTARKGSIDKCSVLMLTRASIVDSPIFSHRGILMDTSRNFIPLEDLKRTIDGMGSVKLNVFHWHVVDSHSFPLELSKLPQMSKLGAYSPAETYSVKEQRELIEYAKLRGVRIVLEIDSPAHAGNGWQWAPSAGLGNLVLCANEEPWEELCYQPPCGQLNPANPNLYKVLSSMFSEINDRFTTHDMFHLGGDEVKLECWNRTDVVREYVRARWGDLSDQSYHSFWAEFHQKTLSTWDKAVGHNYTNVILWTSDLTDPYFIRERLDPKRFIIQSWTSQNSDVPHQLLKLGYKVIFSTTDTWYLDHGFWGRTTYHDWKVVYNYMIPRAEAVLGGEVCMWSEYVDRYALDVKVWPRAAALAERLWSDPTEFTKGYKMRNGDSNQVEYRLASVRDRLIRLGITPDQIMPRWCYLNQGKC